MNDNQMILNRLSMGSMALNAVDEAHSPALDLVNDESLAAHARIDIKGIRAAIARVEAQAEANAEAKPIELEYASTALNQIPADDHANIQSEADSDSEEHKSLKEEAKFQAGLRYKNEQAAKKMVIEQIKIDTQLNFKAKIDAEQLAAEAENAKQWAAERAAASYAAKQEAIERARVDAKIAEQARERERQEREARLNAERLAKIRNEAQQISRERDQAGAIA